MKITKPRLRQRAGFTLIEALMVLIVVGIAAAVVMPSWGEMGQSTKANAAAGVVMTDLQRMFSEAQKNKRPVRLVVNAANQRYTVTDRLTGAVIWTRYLSGATGEYEVTGLTSTVPATIDFFPNGLASSGITIAVTVRSETRTVTMTRVGHVRIS